MFMALLYCSLHSIYGTMRASWGEELSNQAPAQFLYMSCTKHVGCLSRGSYLLVSNKKMERACRVLGSSGASQWITPKRVSFTWHREFCVMNCGFSYMRCPILRDIHLQILFYVCLSVCFKLCVSEVELQVFVHHLVRWQELNSARCSLGAYS